MHEMSIALGIVRIAEEEVKKAKAEKVERIELIIGELSGVEKDSLDFAWPLAVKETVLEHAKVEIDYIPGKALCSDCNTQFALHSLYDECPNCKSYFRVIQNGQELKVLALEVI